jgi:sterol desaturase/sphingolipid hydroxylase (fatty acid hydroxylase superfamily)
MEIVALILINSVIVLLPAVVVLGTFWLIFWKIKPAWIVRYRVPQPREQPTIPGYELPRAIAFFLMYQIPIVVVFSLQKYFGYTPRYEKVSEHGWLYFCGSLLLLIFVIDTVFYWTHRWFHHNPFLRRLHHVHHASYNITPASAYSFHPFESLIIMLPYLVLVVVMPWHPMVLNLYAAFGLNYGAYNHLGYDFSPGVKKKFRFLKWMSSASYHAIHHQKYESNYGLYFTIWDRVMKTEHRADSISARG